MSLLDLSETVTKTNKVMIIVPVPAGGVDCDLLRLQQLLSCVDEHGASAAVSVETCVPATVYLRQGSSSRRSTHRSIYTTQTAQNDKKALLTPTTTYDACAVRVLTIVVSTNPYFSPKVGKVKKQLSNNLLGDKVEPAWLHSLFRNKGL